MINKSRLLALGAMAAVFACGSIWGNEEKIQLSSLQTPSQEDEEELTQEEILQISEAFGHFIGRNLKNPGVQFNVEKVITGMRAGADGKPSPMNDKEYEEKMFRLQKISIKKLSDENLKKATEFLSKNKSEPNVVEVEPGKLQYLILEAGNGPTVEAHGNPMINYTGKYLDGTVFGSSVEAGGPINIPLDHTIPGFGKGIQGMKEGEKRRLFIHPDLAYGTSGHLPPNSLLIFDIEVVKAEAPKSADAEEEEEDLLPLALDEDGGDELHDGDSGYDHEDSHHEVTN
jgi:peptidylprolyl isomerase